MLFNTQSQPSPTCAWSEESVSPGLGGLGPIASSSLSLSESGLLESTPVLLAPVDLILTN